MDMKYIALLIAIGGVFVLYKFLNSNRKAGLGLLSVIYMVYWGLEYFLTH